ncbi:uncharacterized protein BXZ73DRAFT_74797 [Epithele typhae]|uniref:uncharacterized protein n=1 Tax=Epithele typhae TaxID=378194 RepID=UPI0020076D64|nr:uncharacterized protein BXZ73DRAFT_74797 [Epithele typhae]KAH9941576.1 hypothetical protein BXZ73DRAFT_74797 [Epithele typhae]
MNPFAQGNWNGQSTSVYGALPSLSTPATQLYTVTYTFINFKSTILNSTIVGPDGRTAYIVSTEANAPAYTIFKDTEKRNIGMVQWQPYASVEIRGGSARQRVRDWLRLSSDQSRRIMEANRVQYAWAPMDGFVCLYKVHSSAPRILGRVSRSPTAVSLELTAEAVQLGLTEPALVATAMLSSGHNID